jgi:hypothetical protein
MGPIEEAVRKEIPEGSAVSEIAYKLAFSLDEGQGSVAMARELRTILAEHKPKPRYSSGVARMKLINDDDD